MARKDPRREMDRPVAGPLLSAKLPALVEQLKAEEAWDEGDRNSRTLFKARGLRVVLLAMREGARLERHEAKAPVTIQVIEGQVELDAQGEVVALKVGALVQLGPHVSHALAATTDSAVLITLGGA